MRWPNSRRKGFRVALVDAEPAPAEESEAEDARALALSAATRNLLAVLDLWPALAPKAQAIAAIDITDSALNAALRPHFLGFDDELKSDGASAFMVEHGDLKRALAAAVAQEPAIAIIAPETRDRFQD